MGRHGVRGGSFSNHLLMLFGDMFYVADPNPLETDPPELREEGRVLGAALWRVLAG